MHNKNNSLARDIIDGSTAYLLWQSHLLGKPHGLTSRNPEHCPDILYTIDVFPPTTDLPVFLKERQAALRDDNLPDHNHALRRITSDRHIDRCRTPRRICVSVAEG